MISVIVVMSSALLALKDVTLVVPPSFSMAFVMHVVFPVPD